MIKKTTRVNAESETIQMEEEMYQNFDL